MYLACSVSKILSTCTVLYKVQSAWESSFLLPFVFQEGKNTFHEEEIHYYSLFCVFVRFYFEVGEIRIFYSLRDCHPCK